MRSGCEIVDGMKEKSLEESASKKMVFFEDIVSGNCGDFGKKMGKYVKVRVDRLKVRVNFDCEEAEIVKSVKVRVNV